MMPPAVIAQYLLPHRFLSSLVRRATRWRFRPWKNFLIRTIVRGYHVDLGEAEIGDPDAYPHFNAFFTRALKPGARPLDARPDAIVSPCDGRVGQIGRIRDGRIVQAKGRDFSVGELLADPAIAPRYRDGSFLTAYLSPRDYHRVHMPLAGTLVETVHVPGRIFSVAPKIVAEIPRLFARNERLVCHFEGEHGPFAVILVGAILVSGIATVWDGVVIPPYASAIVRRDHAARGIRLDRGEELGRFEMGSTVIVLLPAGLGAFSERLGPESGLRMGEKVGKLNA